MPTASSTSTTAVFFSAKSAVAGADVWPLREIKIAAASITAMR